MDKPSDRNVFRNAWVVDDIEAACLKWVNEMGVGPFFLNEYDNVFSNVTYRGQPGELNMITAIAQAGPVQIELIQPTVDRCAYRDSVAAGNMGFLHMCVWTHDMAADTAYFANLGYVAANSASIGSVQFAYFDTRPLMGCMLEVIDQDPGGVARFEAIAAAAVDWDGRDPLRY